MDSQHTRSRKMTSLYLVEPIKRHWKNVLKLAHLAKVNFSPDQLELAEAIFNHKPNASPLARPRVVGVREMFGPSSPSEETSYPFNGVPAHPVLMLTLLTGVNFNEGWNQHDWTYRNVVSSYLLVHPDGRKFTLLLDGGYEKEIQWEGRFLPERRCIGRSLYVCGFPKEKEFDQMGYFIPDAEGRYGRSYTTF